MWFLKYYKKHFDLTWFGEGKDRSREKSIMKNSVRFFLQLFGLWKYFEMSS